MPSLQVYNQSLSRQEALHLLHRVGIGHNQAELDALEGMNSSAAIDFLLAQQAPTPAPPIDHETGTTFFEREEIEDNISPTLHHLYNANWWLKNMKETSSLITEKMTLFHSLHFTTNAEKVFYSFPIYHQNALFRHYAIGNFKTLTRKILYDAAMNVYLDGFTNTNANPNENFAREFLELYSIGKGEQIGEGNYTTYTEDDVREAARVLTGIVPITLLPENEWPAGQDIEYDADTGLYKNNVFPFWHDDGTKQFSSAFQNTTISTGANTAANIEAEFEAFIDMIFDQDATALHICRKLYRYFVYYDITPEIEADIIVPLAATFRDNGYELLPVLEQLFKSAHFFDADDAEASNNNIGGIVKSPYEIVINTLKYFDVNVGDSSNWELHHEALSSFTNFMNEMGMPMFQPPEVAGYPAYHQAPSYNRNWISGTTLLARYISAVYLIFGYNLGNIEVKLDTVDFVRNSGNIPDPSNPNNMVQVLTDDLFPMGIDTDKQVSLKNILTDGDPDAQWTIAWDDYIASGNDGTVRVRLDALFNSILQSPEYQLS